MKSNPDRIAWIVLLLSFGAFCALVVGVPLGIRWYVLTAETEQKALIETLAGTVVIEPEIGQGPLPLTKGQSMVVSSDTVIYTDETSEAVITFFDHSFMRLYPGSSVRLDRLSAPRFKASPLPKRIYLNLFQGHIRIGTALSLERDLDFRVQTPYAQSVLDQDGSYALRIRGDFVEITSYRGQASVIAQGQKIELAPRQRTSVRLGAPPETPVGVARNLVRNSEFNPPLAEWQIFNDQGTDGGNIDGQVEMVVDEGRNAVRFYRTNAQGNHCETVLEQVINEQLPDPVTSLTVRATVKVRYQGLSGGGYLSSEYPLMIRLTYRDVYDSEAEWVQGFYYQNVDNNPTTYGLQIPRDRWFLFESENLLELLPIKPYRITKIRVYASGWDYESLVSDVSVIVE